MFTDATFHQAVVLLKGRFGIYVVRGFACK